MRNLTWLFLTLLMGNAFAQSPTHKLHGLKISNLSSMQHLTTTNRNIAGYTVSVTQVRTFDALQLIPAYLWQTKRGDFGELSIPMWQIQRQKITRSDTLGNGFPGISMKVNFGVQYTYSIRFFKGKECKWLPMLGFGMMPYLSINRYLPGSSIEFPTRNHLVGLAGTLQPHVMWNPNPRFFMDFGIVLNAFDFTFSNYSRIDPQLYIQEGYTLSWNLANGHNGIQIGAGVKL